MRTSVSRLTAYFTGHVQGVGFRYTVLQVARGFVVTGTVANLADGRVQLEGEGERDELEAFLAEVKSSLSSHVSKSEENWGSGDARFKDFMILPGLL